MVTKEFEEKVQADLLGNKDAIEKIGTILENFAKRIESLEDEDEVKTESVDENEDEVKTESEDEDKDIMIQNLQDEVSTLQAKLKELEGDEDDKTNVESDEEEDEKSTESDEDKNEKESDGEDEEDKKKVEPEAPKLEKRSGKVISESNENVGFKEAVQIYFSK